LFPAGHCAEERRDHTWTFANPIVVPIATSLRFTSSDGRNMKGSSTIT
jgi:hypothetical protein